MKKKILLFFILNTLLFSNDYFISSNGSMSFNYSNKDNRVLRLNGNMKTNKIDINSIELGIYYKGDYYLLSKYVISKHFIDKTNIFETVAKLPFGTVKTMYIPSMLDKNSFYITNVCNIENNNSLEFLYLYNMSDKNGLIRYEKKPQNLYIYNDNIYIKNLKNDMSAYIINENNLDTVELKKIVNTTIKYSNQRIIMASKISKRDTEHSDIIEIKFVPTNNHKSAASVDTLLYIEKEYWINWFRPINLISDNITKKNIERFLIYLKTSLYKSNFYTNIGVKESSQIENILYTAFVFIKYGYLNEAKNILIFLKKNKILQLNSDNNILTLEKVQYIYLNLIYLKTFHDLKFYNNNIKYITTYVDLILKKINQNFKRKNILKKENKFNIFYYTYNILKMYNKVTLNNRYVPAENILKNYLYNNFINRNNIKKQILHDPDTFSKWSNLSFYNEFTKKNLIDQLYKKTIFNKYPYFSKSKNIDMKNNLDILDGLYASDLGEYGDINLTQINSDIQHNLMKIPNKIYLKDSKKYETYGLDTYLISKYLLTIKKRKN